MDIRAFHNLNDDSRLKLPLINVVPVQAILQLSLRQDCGPHSTVTGKN
jgi:hypothetical protein